MSSIIPPKPRLSAGTKVRISIVAAKFNQEYTDALVENAVQEIDSYTTNARVDLVRVPGAFEIPVVCKALIEEEQPDCVIALGCIGKKLNRGREAARSALEIIDIMSEVRRANQSLRLHPSNG